MFHNTCNSLSLVIKSIFNFYIFNFYSFKRKRYSIPTWLHLNKKIIVLRLLLLVFPSGGYSQSLKSVYPQPLSHSSLVDTDFITKAVLAYWGHLSYIVTYNPTSDPLYIHWTLIGWIKGLLLLRANAKIHIIILIAKHLYDFISVFI